VIGDVCATIYFNDENINFLCRSLKDYTSPVAILDLHITTRHGNGMIFGFVAERVLKAFNVTHLSEDEYDHLLSTVKKSSQTHDFDPRKFLMGLNENMINSNDVIEYLELKKKELSSKEIIPKPNYVSLQEDENEEMYKSFSLESLDIKNEDVSETPESIKEILNKFVKIKPQKVESGEEAPLTVDEAIDIYLTTKMNNSTLDKKPSKVIYQRYYGPVNAIADVNCCSLSFEGPCCMFYCICKTFDFEDPEVQDVDDFKHLAQAWFKGHCDYCEKTISNFRYAVRFPLAYGGWEGCYCNYNCLYKSKNFFIFCLALPDSLSDFVVML
jgi:hypothetical protein